MSDLRKRYLLCLMSACLLAPARAAELATLPLEKLLQVEVEGASRFMQPLTEAPSAVSVVTAEDIRQFGFRTLGEALQSMRGVYTTSEREYTYLGIRGFARPGDYNTRMLMLTDGVRRNDPLYDDAMIGNEAPIEMDWVKRLEFVPGPSSALYGANAIFGVANAVLWSGYDLNGTRARIDAGSGNLTRFSLLSGKALEAGGDWLFGIAASGRRGENLYFSEFDNPPAGNGIAQHRDGERYIKSIAKLNTGNWQIDAGYSFRNKDVPTGYFGTSFDEPGTYVTDQYAYADVGYGKALSAEWNSNLRLRAGEYRFAAQYVYPGLRNRDEARATWLGLDYLLAYSGHKDHKLIFGAEVQSNRHLDQRNFDLSPQVPHLDDRRSGSSSGVYVQDEWRLDAQWLANLGLRADRVAGFGAVSPRAALIHQPTPATALKLIYGRAFRAPNAYERYYNDGNVLQKANPDLKLERITTHEIVVDHAVTATLRIAGSYYHYRIDGLIDQITDTDGMLAFVNRSTIHADGVEAEAEALLAGGIRAKGSIARQHVKQSFEVPANSPGWLGKLLIDGPLFATGWTLGFDWQAMDKRHALGGQVPGHAVGNLILRRKGLPHGGNLSVGIYNLSGHRYLDPTSAAVARGAIYQDGRQLRVSWEIGY